MRQDLDRLMQERNIDAFVIFGNDGKNVYRDYMTGGAKAHTTVLKKRGEEAVLIANGMEVDEAQKSGLKVYTNTDFDFYQIWQQYSTYEERSMAYWRNVFTKLGIQGRVAFYGEGDVMGTWKQLRRIQKHLSDILEIVEDNDESIFDVARATKDNTELNLMREVGQKASATMVETRDWISNHRVQDETLVKSDGKPLTIGDVKVFINQTLLKHGLMDEGSVIFAQGRDAGVPHSRGEREDALKLGQTIVFDLFPKNPDNGYYHDMTRTWCLGYASDEVKKAYDVVLRAFTQSLEAISVGEKTSKLQHLVCDIFESQGHPTSRNTPGTNEGYVHSLGHGLGLDVHETPGMSHINDEPVFKKGHVVTIEPGLYYPDKGWGIRIEDTVFIDHDGHPVNITECPYDLVIPIQN